MSMPATDLKPLCLSFWTPPVVRPQSILIGKMLPEWIRQGLTPAVITYDVCGRQNAAIPTYHVPAFKAQRIVWYSSLLTRLAYTRYYEAVYRISLTAIENQKPDIVFSFSNPQASNVLGAYIKKRLGVPFVSHFSDPYYDNPYNTYGRRAAKNVLRTEQFIIEQSDAVVFVNDTLRDLVMRKYAPSLSIKTAVIPHCFDRALYPPADRSRTAALFIMSHIGAFYRLRTPEPLFQALALMKKRRPRLEDSLIVRLIGGVNDYAKYGGSELERLVRKFNLEKIVEVLPVMNYKDSLGAMVQSDCLLVIDSDIPGSPFLPSKLIDYIGSGKAIVGITPPDSPTHRVLQELGARSFQHRQAAELADYLEALVFRHDAPRLNAEYAQTFDVSSTTQQLITVFKRLVKK
jgi:hypothetical protein